MPPTDEQNLRPATTASLDHRVARVEADLGALSTRFDDFRSAVDRTLARIEAAVTAPSPTDAATAVMLADLARRMAAGEATDAAQQKAVGELRNEQLSMSARIGTVAAIAKSVGVGGLLALMGLVAFYVVQTGKLP